MSGLVSRPDAPPRRKLGRSLAVFHLEAGGCGGCASELQMLGSAAYDLARHGLQFVDSPRAANVLLVTGPVTRTMAKPVLATWDALPEPKWLVAAGDCAIEGGVFRGSGAVAGGVGAVLPVDLVIPGNPPAPEQVLAGLRAILETNL